MTDEDTATEERLLTALAEAHAPRVRASELAAYLECSRGAVRTGLQSLADDDRVVRHDEGTTALWSLPERADEPDPQDSDDETDGGDGDEIEESEGDGADATAPASETDGDSASAEASADESTEGEPAAESAEESADEESTEESAEESADEESTEESAEESAAESAEEESSERNTSEPPAESGSSETSTDGRGHGTSSVGEPTVVALPEEDSDWPDPVFVLAGAVGLLAVLALLRLRRR